ncbi:MAG: tetratricopeptide repeat protein [Myxococcota bacterium]|nr:tetratricopeptide repeat protein [Myxococcota bacterium]
MARKASAAENEEFLQALYRGGELLAAGKVIEAKDLLEKAHQLQPKNEKGQNLLGLTYFKLGLFDRAAEIYEGLVRENPADPTLRVNLGLVYLKTNALPRAIREFETATDLSPEHKKAQNYLGVALAQAGEFARAKEHFILAGSEAMAEKMDRALKGDGGHPQQPPTQPAQTQGFAEIEGSEVVAERGGQVPAAETGEHAPITQQQAQAYASEEIPVEQQQAHQALQQTDWGSQFEGDGGTGEAYEQPGQEGQYEPPPAAVSESDLDAFSEESMSAAPSSQPVPEMMEVELEAAPVEAYAELPPPPPELPPPPPEEVDSFPMAEERPEEVDSLPMPEEVRPPAPRAPVAGIPGRSAEEVDGALTLPIAELAPTLQLFPPPVQGPFLVRGELAALVITDELLTRLSGLVSVVGKVEFKPETKRFRGRATDKPFGEGDRRMVRAKGQGMVIVDTGDQKFVSLELADESGYFQEEQVFSFEEALSFENGRVPSDIPPDLDLVHLRGKGRVLLAISGPLRSLEIAMERPVTVPMVNLVGWYGNLTPKVIPLLPDAKGKSSRSAVELSGEGFALISVPMR